MNEELTKTAIDYFDLEDASSESQEEFFAELGEIIFDSIMNKAWTELDTKKSEELNSLLEESNDNPKDEKKREAIFNYLDKHLVNLQGFVKNEVEEIQKTYKTIRDEIRDETQE